MHTYLCTRDGNALEYRPHEFRPGGILACWQCEQRVRHGLPLLPARQETPIEALRKVADEIPDSPRYLELTQGMKEAKRMYAEWNRGQRAKAARRARGLKQGGWTDKEAQRQHLRRIAAERSRPFWQEKAEQFELAALGA